MLPRELFFWSSFQQPLRPQAKNPTSLPPLSLEMRLELIVGLVVGVTSFGAPQSSNSICGNLGSMPSYCVPCARVLWTQHCNDPPQNTPNNPAACTATVYTTDVQAVKDAQVAAGFTNVNNEWKNNCGNCNGYTECCSTPALLCITEPPVDDGRRRLRADAAAAAAALRRLRKQKGVKPDKRSAGKG